MQAVARKSGSFFAVRGIGLRLHDAQHMYKPENMRRKADQRIHRQHSLGSLEGSSTFENRPVAGKSQAWLSWCSRVHQVKRVTFSHTGLDGADGASSAIEESVQLLSGKGGRCIGRARRGKNIRDDFRIEIADDLA